MDIAQTTGMELFGLFELDITGTVLYHRFDPVSDSRTQEQIIAGTNFYDDVARFQNTEEFRRYVTQFTSSAKLADSFDFDCHYDGTGLPVKVLLARIRGDSPNPDNTKSILVHIREARNDTDAQVRADD